MNKSVISIFVRKLGLMHLADRANFYYQKYKNRSSNKMFKENNPGVALPPDYMMYESFQMNYEYYFNDSVSTAEWLLSYFKKYIELKNIKILEWGCGPARIIRHLPGLLGNTCEVFGSDYNKQTVEWCKKNILNITFVTNNLEPPLDFSDNFFDIIYANSVLTHLSEEMHYAWFDELQRISKKGRIIFLTTHGDNCKPILTSRELEKYETGEIVIRGNVKEGHRTYAAYQPTKFMRKLFSEVEILEHIKREQEGNYIPPDIWIVRKK